MFWSLWSENRAQGNSSPGNRGFLKNLKMCSFHISAVKTVFLSHQNRPIQVKTGQNRPKRLLLSLTGSQNSRILNTSALSANSSRFARVISRDFPSRLSSVAVSPSAVGTSKSPRIRSLNSCSVVTPLRLMARIDDRLWVSDQSMASRSCLLAERRKNVQRISSGVELLFFSEYCVVPWWKPVDISFAMFFKLTNVGGIRWCSILLLIQTVLLILCSTRRANHS